jgi:hypothetical protein
MGGSVSLGVCSGANKYYICSYCGILQAESELSTREIIPPIDNTVSINLEKPHPIPYIHAHHVA